MSGHSKWSTIKHKKAAADQKRGQAFSKIAKDIEIAVHEGKSGDAEQNPRLRLILAKAREANMPSDNIKRAIDRGLGKDDGVLQEQIVYEGYGPGGIAVITVVETDNRQRTSAELRHCYERSGGSLGGPGSAMFLFTKVQEGFEAKVRIPVRIEDKGQFHTFLDSLHQLPEVVGVYTNVESS